MKSHFNVRRRMRWSIKSLLLYMAAFAICLVLGRLPLVLSALGIILLIGILGLTLPGVMSRRVGRGVAIGLLATFLSLLLIGGMADLVSSLSQRDLSLIIAPRLSYIIQLGAFAGGTAGLLYDKLCPIRSPRILDDRIRNMSKTDR